jgi:hypothetical protein
MVVLSAISTESSATSQGSERVSISGNLRTMPFPDLLQWVAQSRQTGTLALEGNPYKKKIYFRDGLVVAASSEDPKEFLGYYLVGWGFVAEEELQELLDMQDDHGTLLGELLVIIGRLSREDLLHILQVKTEESIFELFLWKEGDFRFLENILPAKKFQPLNIAVDMLILEGVRRTDEWTRCRESIPDPRWVPKLVRAVDVQELGQTELSILREINGENSIEDIALACRLALFHVLLFVYQGMSHGLFELNPPGSDEQTPIPGFSEASWRSLIRNAEIAIESGDLAQGFERLTALRAKYSDRREVSEQFAGLEKMIAYQLERKRLSERAIPELVMAPAELTEQSFSPQEAFLLSRINGVYTLGEIFKMVPGSELELRIMVDGLIQRQVVGLKGAGGELEASPAEA